MSARYLTTTLPYVNADPHLGHALELVQADALARFWRARGDDVFFNTGTDEHGQKIFEAAKKAGKDVRAYVDQYAAEFKKLPEALGLDSPTFIRTTEQKHIEAAQEMWRRCAVNGDIYEKEYEGLYCVGHEAFVTEKELVDGKCPEHGAAPQALREKNYFFKFKKYEPFLLQYLKQPGAIVPEWRRQEAIKFVEGGLEDFSISRERERLTWGIPVPGDDSQVMYVWFDALTSYISTLGWPSDPDGNFKKYWQEGKTLQLAGKDQVRFQSLMFQAMLKSAGAGKPTDTVFYHGFITSGGQKMSKSLGNVINPHDLVKKYGTDATRYILLRHVSPFDDSDLTLEAIHEHYTAHLTNGLGNLVARVMKLAETYLPEAVKIPRLEEITPETKKYIDTFEFNLAMDHLWHWMQTLDECIQEQKTFEVVKTNKIRGQKQLTSLLTQLAEIAVLLEPFMPDTNEKILDAIRTNKKPENLFPRI